MHGKDDLKLQLASMIILCSDIQRSLCLLGIWVLNHAALLCRQQAGGAVPPAPAEGAPHQGASLRSVDFHLLAPVSTMAASEAAPEQLNTSSV